MVVASSEIFLEAAPSQWQWEESEAPMGVLPCKILPPEAVASLHLMRKKALLMMSVTVTSKLVSMGLQLEFTKASLNSADLS